MIRSLKIESYLLLKSQYIEFKEGLNVITGESGAGKSMLMDAVKFCLGLKPANEENLVVEIEIDEDIIRREVKGNKSKFYINGIGSNQKTILENWVKDIMFQEQSSQSKIFKKHHQLEILDKEKGISEKLKEFTNIFDELKQKEEKLKELLLKKEALEQNIEQNKELIQDLESLNITKELYQEIKAKSEELKHSEKINMYIQSILNALEYSEHNALAKLNYSISQISQAINFKKDLEKILIKLNELKDHLLETTSFIASYKMYVDSELIDKLNETIFKVQSVERKYKKSFEEMFLIYKLQNEYNEKLTNLKKDIKDLFDSIELTKQRALEKAKELSNLRKLRAKELSKSVNEILKFLNLKEAYFNIHIQEKPISRSGIDDVSFLFSSYSKNQLKEISEIASGGEVSRIVLAISSVFGDYKAYVYDEIDTGTSGEASLYIAYLLKDISKNAQVICISHTPALAAASDNHILVKRHLNDISIKNLNEEEKLEEVSRLMGIISKETKLGAKKLIEKFSL